MQASPFGSSSVEQIPGGNGHKTVQPNLGIPQKNRFSCHSFILIDVNSKCTYGMAVDVRLPTYRWQNFYLGSNSSNPTDALLFICHWDMKLKVTSITLGSEH